MEKKYEFDEENPEQHMVNEPAIEYGKKQTVNSPGRYSIEEIREGNFLTNEELDDFVLKNPTPLCELTDEEKLRRIDKAIKCEEDGIYFTHEEIINKYRN